jgi:replicative DNA helicase
MKKRSSPFITAAQSDDAFLERPLPHNREAEQTLLGSVLLDVRSMRDVYRHLKPEDFYVPAHRYIFEAMRTLYEKQQPIDQITIADVLKRDSRLESVGGISFITDLMYGVPVQLNLSKYVQLVRDKSTSRTLIKEAQKVIARALEDEDTADVQLYESTQSFVALHRERELAAGIGRKSFKHVGQKVRQRFTVWREGKTEAISTGIPELDAKLKYGGFAKGDLIYIGAPPSRGKTALVLQIAITAARHGHRVVMFSLEMKDTALFMRVLAGEAWVENWKIRPDMFHFPETVAKIEAAFETVENLPIDIDDETRTLKAFEVAATDAVLNDKAEMIILDYLQVVDPELKGVNREREVASVSTAAQALAKRLSVPVIITTQMSRSAVKNDVRPELDSMRDSGQIEQDADVVLFPYGAKIGEETSDGIRKIAIYCPKQREGRAGWELQDVDFDTEHQRFFTSAMYQADFDAKRAFAEREERRAREQPQQLSAMAANITDAEFSIDPDLDAYDFTADEE